MSKRIYVELKGSILAGGGNLEAGEFIELPEKSANALINEGLAVLAEKKGNDDQNDPPKLTGEGTGDDSGQGGTNTQDEDKTPGEGSQGEITTTDKLEADRETTYKTIYGRYKDDELRPLAKEHGVDFAYDATKKDLVNAIIDQGKADKFLQ